MYLRDFLAVLLAVGAMYFSLEREGSFSYRKAWHHQVSHDKSLLYETVRLPPPFLCDLNGDGRMELLSTTYDGRLQLLKPMPPGKKGEGFAAAQILAEVQVIGIEDLIRSENSRKATHFVAVKTGFIDPMPDNLVSAPRKEVVVVLTADWQVHCFDHNLNRLWHQQLDGHLGKHALRAATHEVAILITGHTIRQQDRGMVVVGGSVLHGDHQHAGTGDLLQDEELLEEEKAHHNVAGEEGEDVDEDEEIELSGRTSKYFSYFAFEGGSGSMRWKHQANDFHKNEVEMSELLTPQHNYRLSAKEMERKEFGEISCRNFRSSVIDALPHKWERREDTLFKLSHFSKHKQAKGPQKREISSQSSANVGDSTAAAGVNHGNLIAKTMSEIIKPFSGSSHSSNQELASGGHGNGAGGSAITATRTAGRGKKHSSAPNVFVAHLAEGIQAIHLYTGRSICKLHLASPGLHADLNGDGIIEHVQVYGKDPEYNYDAQHSLHHAIPGCSTVVTAGIPAHQVFNASVCKYMKSKSSLLRRGAHLSELEITHPALLPLSAHRIAADPHHQGQKKHKYDLVFLNSYGEVTCVSNHGHRKWSVQAGSGWSDLDSLSEVDKVAPTLRTMELRIHAHNYVVLTAGAFSANILSAHGRKLESIDFPAKPNLDLQVMDFNNDGLNDLLLCTADGYYGYAQVRHFSTVPFTGLLACLLVAMISVYVSLHGTGKKGKVKRGTEVVD